MNHYLLAVCYPPDAQPPSEAELADIMTDVDAFEQEAKDAGVWVFSGGLHDPSTATTVRLEAGEVVLTDGPFIESKEVLGGVAIIRVPDLDAALVWAGKSARALRGTPIEVRPFVWTGDGPER